MINEVLLFDVGGVLADWDGTTPLVELTNGRMTREQARRFWLEFGPLKPFEKGHESVHEFARSATEALALDMSREEFAMRFDSWMHGLYDGALELIARIRPEPLKAILSNNNPIHWRRLEQEGLSKPFDAVFVSHKIGVRKPDPECFEYVLGALKRPAEVFLFFDDNHECVEAARRAGMRAEHVCGLQELEAALQRYGYLV